jgi:hypothetical protein
MTRILEGKNRASASEAASFVDKIEQEERDFEKFKMGKLAEIAAEQAKVAKRKAEIVDDAHSQKVPKSMLRSLVKARAKDRKGEKLKDESREILNELESDDKDYAVDIWKALGGYADLPLGAAAVQREEKQSGGADPIASAADKAWSEADPQKNKAPETAH